MVGGELEALIADVARMRSVSPSQVVERKNALLERLTRSPSGVKDNAVMSLPYPELVTRLARWLDIVRERYPRLSELEALSYVRRSYLTGSGNGPAAGLRLIEQAQFERLHDIVEAGGSIDDYLAQGVLSGIVVADRKAAVQKEWASLLHEYGGRLSRKGLSKRQTHAVLRPLSDEEVFRYNPSLQNCVKAGRDSPGFAAEFVFRDRLLEIAGVKYGTLDHAVATTKGTGQVRFWSVWKFLFSEVPQVFRLGTRDSSFLYRDMKVPLERIIAHIKPYMFAKHHTHRDERFYNAVCEERKRHLLSLTGIARSTYPMLIDKFAVEKLESRLLDWIRLFKRECPASTWQESLAYVSSHTLLNNARLERAVYVHEFISLLPQKDAALRWMKRSDLHPVYQKVKRVMSLLEEKGYPAREVLKDFDYRWLQIRGRKATARFHEFMGELEARYIFGLLGVKQHDTMYARLRHAIEPDLAEAELNHWAHQFGRETSRGAYVALQFFNPRWFLGKANEQGWHYGKHQFDIAVQRYYREKDKHPNRESYITI